MHNHKFNRKLHQVIQNLTQHTEVTHPYNVYSKLAFPKGGVLSITQLYTIYTSDLPPARPLIQVMAYADDITITYIYTNAAKKYIQPYLYKVFV